MSVLVHRYEALDAFRERVRDLLKEDTTHENTLAQIEEELRK